MEESTEEIIVGNIDTTVEEPAEAVVESTEETEVL